MQKCCTPQRQRFTHKARHFRNLMWYTLPEGSKHYPLSIVRVKEILSINARSERVDELQPVDLSSNKLTEPEHAFVDVVGQISLNSLEKSSRRRKEKQRENDNRQRPKPPAGNNNTGRQPEQRKPVKTKYATAATATTTTAAAATKTATTTKTTAAAATATTKTATATAAGRRPQPPGNPPADKNKNIYIKTAHRRCAVFFCSHSFVKNIVAEPVSKI